MTVGELIEELETCNPNATVVLSSDEEGNRIHSLFCIGEGMWYEDVELGVYDSEYVQDDPNRLEELEEDGVDLVPAICLWP